MKISVHRWFQAFGKQRERATHAIYIAGRNFAFQATPECMAKALPFSGLRCSLLPPHRDVRADMDLLRRPCGIVLAQARPNQP